MGTTASGLRYPEPTDPVAQGAAAMKNLADDVTSLYVGKSTGPASLQPWGGAVPAGGAVRMAAGVATLVFAASSTVAFVVPNGGKAWSQLLAVLISGANNTQPAPGNQYAAAASPTLGTVYVTGYTPAGAALVNTTVNVQYVAVGI